MMRTNKFVIFLIIFFSVHLSLFAQDKGWELEKETDDLKIYTRDGLDSDIKELRITTYVNASLSTIAALLCDVPAYSDWVYKCSSSKTLTTVNNRDVYYYNKVDFPWPLSDRDLILHSKINQDPLSGKITSYSSGVADHIPEIEDIVRIKLIEVTWEIYPEADGRVFIDYHLKSDPGGNLPAWLINLAVDQGPVRSMKKFKDFLKKDKYKRAQLAFIQNVDAIKVR